MYTQFLKKYKKCVYKYNSVEAMQIRKRNVRYGEGLFWGMIRERDAKAVWGALASDLIDVVEVATLLRPVAVAHRYPVLSQTCQVDNDHTALLPHHLKHKHAVCDYTL